jgi:restriction system protein
VGALAIPDYQSLMLPLLRLVADGKDWHISDYTDGLADQFLLTEDERNEMLPSGNQTTIRNRAGWARTYLAKAGLVESVARGTIRITPRGLEVLNSNPEFIDNHFLARFEGFQEFRARTGTRTRPSSVSVIHEQDELLVDPTERLNTAYREIRAALATDLLNQVKQATPQFFEVLVIDLLVAMGYGGSRDDAGQAVGRSGDDGIDGIIKEDRLGLDVVYIQAKRWEHPVSRPTVQAFTGSLEGVRARKGVFITTSRFTTEARDYVDRIEKRIVLIDGEQLANYMIDFGIGVTDVTTLHIRRIDQDYFEG